MQGSGSCSPGSWSLYGGFERMYKRAHRVSRFHWEPHPSGTKPSGSGTETFFHRFSESEAFSKQKGRNVTLGRNELPLKRLSWLSLESVNAPYGTRCIIQGKSKFSTLPRIENCRTKLRMTTVERIGKRPFQFLVHHSIPHFHTCRSAKLSEKGIWGMLGKSHENLCLSHIYIHRTK